MNKKMKLITMGVLLINTLSLVGCSELTVDEMLEDMEGVDIRSEQTNTTTQTQQNSLYDSKAELRGDKETLSGIVVDSYNENLKATLKSYEEDNFFSYIVVEIENLSDKSYSLVTDTMKLNGYTVDCPSVQYVSSNSKCKFEIRFKKDDIDGYLIKTVDAMITIRDKYTYANEQWISVSNIN